MSQFPNLARWRLDNGSRCDVCPARGQRVVGTDGSPSASHICVAEAPGQQEEEWGIRYGDEFGRPLVGPTGALWKHEELAPAGLADIIPREGKPDLPLLRDVFATNVAMCRPPNNKMDTPVGRKMAMACSNSLRRLIRRLLAENPDRTLEWMGATALAFSQGKLGKPARKGQKKPSIGAWRGRPIEPTERALARLNAALEDVPDNEIDAYCLRGVKPSQEWWPTQYKILKQILTWNRRSAKVVAATPPKEAVVHISVVQLLVSRQKAAIKRKEKADGKT